jgi:CobB/CobQ-like glutamine amidotransferase domain
MILVRCRTPTSTSSAVSRTTTNPSWPRAFVVAVWDGWSRTVPSSWQSTPATQVLGTRFQDADGSHHDGIGLLDVASSWDERAEGLAITRPEATLGLPAMSGYGCHHRRTCLGAGVRPLAALELGVGDGGSPPGDGAVAGTVVGTYQHRPMLARNPEVTDLLLSWAVGRPLEPAGAGYAGELRRQRIAEDRRDPSGWGGRVYGRPQLFKRGVRAAARHDVRS